MSKEKIVDVQCIIGYFNSGTFPIRTDIGGRQDWHRPPFDDVPDGLKEACQELYDANRPLADNEVRNGDKIYKLTIFGTRVLIGGAGWCWFSAGDATRDDWERLYPGVFDRCKAFWEANQPKIECNIRCNDKMSKLLRQLADEIEARDDN